MKINNYDTTLEELKTCPFCGSNPIAYLRGNEYTKSKTIFIKCKQCHMVMSQSVLKCFGKPIEWLEGVMIERWNTRT